MENIEKLVKALRCDELDCVDCEWQEKCNGVPGCLIRHEAADALESLRAENERIRSSCYPRDGVEAIIRERDRFKAERDAAVERALAVDPVRWIPVEERLPEIGERVLTLSKWGHVSDRELRKYLNGGIYFWPDGLKPGVDVKYWAPLPEPPKEEPER